MTIIKEDRFEGLPKTFSSIQSEIYLARRKDDSLQAEDNAKKRAIKMSRNYDEFKNLVNTNHLKPVIKNGKFQLTDSTESVPITLVNYGVSQGPSLQSEPITDSVAFMKQFRRSGDKVLFLVNNSTNIPTLFQSGIDEALFFEIIDIILKKEGRHGLNGVYGLFKSLSWWVKMSSFLSKNELTLLNSLES
jgi:Dynein attachment factor N-terminus